MVTEVVEETMAENRRSRESLVGIVDEQGGEQQLAVGWQQVFDVLD
jgi:hypothetical protein